MKKIKINKISVMFLVVIMIIGILPVRIVAATVKLNKPKATIYVGSSTTLKISGAKSKVKWTTSNKKIATVTRKGKVTAKKAGTVTITAKLKKKSYKCKVIVKTPSLNSAKKTLMEGKTFTLKITGTAAKSWISSNKLVATVSSKGKVTAKKAGTATITCKGKNGKKYKCKITVKANTNTTVKTNTNESHTHVYGASTISTQATDYSVGYMKYTCKICGESIIKEYGKEQTFSHRLVDKTATLYGYWDSSEAQKIMESINQYRKSNGYSELTLKDEYVDCAIKQVQAGYFGIDDFDIITASGRYPTFMCSTSAAATNGTGYFDHYLADNTKFFEKEDIEVGIGFFVDIIYWSFITNTFNSTYTNDYTYQLTNYYVAVCVYEK